MEKIIQIIPAPENLFAQYQLDGGTHSECPVAFIGLSETGEIHFLDFDESGIVDEVTDSENFIRLVRR